MQTPEAKKDGGWYCWLVIAAIVVSMLLLSMATYGAISVFVYIWAEKFNIPTEQVLWASSIMNGFRFLLGEYLNMQYNNVILQYLYAQYNNLIIQLVRKKSF